MTIILTLLTICVTLLTVHAFLIHRKLAKMQDYLEHERHCRHILEEFHISLEVDYREHMYKYH